MKEPNKLIKNTVAQSMFIKRHSDQLYFFCAVLFVAVLPFSIDHFQIGNFLMYALLAAGLNHYFFHRHTNHSLRMIALVMVIFLVMHLIGLSQTDNWRQAKLELETKIGLLVFPLAFFFAPVFDAKKVKWLLFVFVAACTLTIGLCLVVAVFKYFGNPGSEFPVYHELSGIVNMRANYLAMYLCFSILLLFSIFQPSSFRLVAKETIIFILIFAILSAGIVLLASRIHILFFVAAVMANCLIFLKSRFNLYKSLLVTAIAGALVLVAILMIPQNLDRFKESISYYENRWGESEIRGSIWKCAVRLISEAPVTGVGTGDSRDALENCYKKNDFSSLFHWEGIRFNAHNQYLETTVELGVPALLVLLAFFLVIFRHGIKASGNLIISFLALIAISCVTESVLERQKGILLIAFFALFLMLNFPTKKLLKYESQPAENTHNS